jgi:hypothetical protein
MAKRPVFVSVLNRSEGNFVDERLIEFAWHPGFAAIQKQRNIAALHQAANDLGIEPILEISSRSSEQLGRDLSAFNLLVNVPTIGSVPLESAFQGSKVFANFGNCHDLYSSTPRNAKKQAHLRNQNDLLYFYLGDVKWELEPKTAFYDWLYLRALNELGDPHRLNELARYAAFTDIEFNPQKSFSCQARSCALAVTLLNRGELISALENREEFLRTIQPASSRSSSENKGAKKVGQARLDI